jgi:hypothetical protein
MGEWWEMKELIKSASWWDRDAAYAHQGAINDVEAREHFTGAQVRQAVIHTRQDIAAIFAHLSSANKQLSSTNRLLASLRLMLIVLTLVMIVGIVHHW